MYTLDKKLTYGVGVANQMQSGSNLSTILPATLVPLLLVIIALATLIVAVILYYRRGRKVNIDTGDGRYNAFMIIIIHRLTAIIVDGKCGGRNPSLI